MRREPLILNTRRAERDESIVGNRWRKLNERVEAGLRLQPSFQRRRQMYQQQELDFPRLELHCMRQGQRHEDNQLQSYARTLPKKIERLLPAPLDTPSFPPSPSTLPPAPPPPAVVAVGGAPEAAAAPPLPPNTSPVPPPPAIPSTPGIGVRTPTWPGSSPSSVGTIFCFFLEGPEGVDSLSEPPSSPPWASEPRGLRGLGALGLADERQRNGLATKLGLADYFPRNICLPGKGEATEERGKGRTTRPSTRPPQHAQRIPA
jgi:hypothetical protein